LGWIKPIFNAWRVRLATSCRFNFRIKFGAMVVDRLDADALGRDILGAIGSPRSIAESPVRGR